MKRTKRITRRTCAFSKLNMYLAVLILIFGVIRTKLVYGSFYTLVGKASIAFFALVALLWWTNGYCGKHLRFQYSQLLTFLIVLLNALHIAGTFFLTYTLSIFAAGSWIMEWLSLSWISFLGLFWALYFSWHIIHSDPAALRKKRKRRRPKPSSRYTDYDYD